MPVGGVAARSGGAFGPAAAGRIPARLRLLALLCALALLVTACAPAPRPATPPSPPPPPPPAELRDLDRLPQELAAYFAPEELDRPIFTAQTQASQAARLRELFFAPWHRTRPAHSRAEAFWGLANLKSRRYYGENLLPLSPGFRAQMEALAQPATYPNALLPAVTTANTSLRVLPTARPGFLKPSLPGEGYPFDYWQNSGLLAGSPVLVTQYSADGAWALVESRVAGGWVPVQDLALVDQAFMERWESLPLAAVTREGASVAVRFADAAEPEHLFQGRIGTLLPLAEIGPDGVTVLAPARSASGRAESLAAYLAPGEAEPVPLTATPRNFARLADQLMGQPYGWGGYLGNRDCSALMLDLFAPFGVFLPRNSSQQAREGQFLTWSGMGPADKEAMLLVQGKPLATLLHKPGHIMLYLGRRDGRAVMLHDLWGLRTRSESGEEGRFIVGRVVVTGLNPGQEVPDIARGGQLLPSLDGMTLLAPEAAPITN